MSQAAEALSPASAPAEPALKVTNLVTRFDTPEGDVCAVNDVSFEIHEGETLGIVGESGSGKSQIFMSIMGLLAANGRASGSVRYRGREILGLPTAQLNRVRGEKIAMIFQDPMTSLNPYLKISKQMTEVLVQHKGMNEQDARKRSVELLDLVRIPEAARRFTMYPHEFMPAGRADRRRADHGPRRHGPGPDPQPHARPEARVQHRHCHDHPRSGGDRRPVRPGPGHVRRPDRRGSQRAGDLL
jgi:predicted ABC-type transport system involved in lysophospholipase L1 biosynthesis ATPase subunit